MSKEEEEKSESEEPLSNKKKKVRRHKRKKPCQLREEPDNQLKTLEEGFQGLGRKVAELEQKIEKSDKEGKGQEEEERLDSAMKIGGRLFLQMIVDSGLEIGRIMRESEEKRQKTDERMNNLIMRLGDLLQRLLSDSEAKIEKTKKEEKRHVEQALSSPATSLCTGVVIMRVEYRYEWWNNRTYHWAYIAISCHPHKPQLVKPDGLDYVSYVYHIGDYCWKYRTHNDYYIFETTPYLADISSQLIVQGYQLITATETYGVTDSGRRYETYVFVRS